MINIFYTFGIPTVKTYNFGEFKMPKTILIDLYGVLNNYNGNFDADFIPDIKSGAKALLFNRL